MTTLPTIIAGLAEAMKSNFSLQPHFLSGEFLLYSVSFLCATFLVFIERSGGRKDWKSYANGFIFIGVAIISAFYGILLTAEKQNEYLIKMVSISALFISVPVFLYSQVVNNVPPPDIQAQRELESQVIQTYEPITKKLTISYKQDVAKVLDGQHRIAGLRHYKQDAKTFQCIVTIYIDMELEDQAIVFATIKREQKSVSNSLAADLFAFAESRSPQKTGHISRGH